MALIQTGFRPFGLRVERVDEGPQLLYDLALLRLVDLSLLGSLLGLGLGRELRLDCFLVATVSLFNQGRNGSGSLALGGLTKCALHCGSDLLPGAVPVLRPLGHQPLEDFGEPLRQVRAIRGAGVLDSIMESATVGKFRNDVGRIVGRIEVCKQHTQHVLLPDLPRGQHLVEACRSCGVDSTPACRNLTATVAPVRFAAAANTIPKAPAPRTRSRVSSPRSSGPGTLAPIVG